MSSVHVVEASRISSKYFSMERTSLPIRSTWESSRMAVSQTGRVKSGWTSSSVAPRALLRVFNAALILPLNGAGHCCFVALLLAIAAQQPYLRTGVKN
uniref:Uncharacterized protein n=1 Tax=Globodera pallida TaxID=36090 RepID=A0A183BLD4_GLOPA